MNDETLAYLQNVINRLDNARRETMLSEAEAHNLAYSLKHLIVNELRTDGKYALAEKFEVDYGIH